MKKVYVVVVNLNGYLMCRGVYLTRASANHFVSHLDEPNTATVLESQLEDMHEWIKACMREAAAVAVLRGKKPVVIPSRYQAMDWAVSEIGEAFGARVNSETAWKRNNPDKHEDDTWETEMHQVVMMSILAAGDPLETIEKQLEKWGFTDERS